MSSPRAQAQAPVPWRPGPVASWVLPLVCVVLPVALHVHGTVLPHYDARPASSSGLWAMVLLPLAVPFTALLLGAAVADDRAAGRPVRTGAVVGLALCAAAVVFALTPLGLPLLVRAMD